jgi:hypothetical protein
MPLLALPALVRSDLTLKRAHAATVSTFIDVVSSLRQDLKRLEDIT